MDRITVRDEGITFIAMRQRVEAFERLADIEDILGDEYDLGQLRELMQAVREKRLAMVAHGAWIMVEPKTGSGLCNNCHWQDRIDPLATHCRYCGAIMDGGSNG